MGWGGLGGFTLFFLFSTLAGGEEGMKEATSMP